VGAMLVYDSTGNVFDGEKIEAYTEYDTPGSINIYGRSKRAGERIVEEILDEYFVFRAGWMVGGWEIDKKFVYKMVQRVRGEDRR
jgi:dTDP-4-dehydrorhamnose reductase